MFRNLAAALAAAACASVAQAQESPQAVLTLDQALAAAQPHAPANQAALAGVEAARAARTVAGLRPNPSLQTQVENVAGSGQFRGFDSAETTVGVSLPIELGGKRSARIASADAWTSRQMLAAAIAEADVRLQVTQLYVAAVASQRRFSVARDQARIAGEAAKAAHIRVLAGRASPLEEQRGQVARISAEAGAEQAARLAEAARINLSRRIGRAISGPLDLLWLDRLPDLLPRGFGPDRADEAQGTLALAAADADLAVADAGVRLAQAQRVPDLSVSPGFRRLSQSGDNAFVVSLSMPIPLFNAGSAAVSQARAESDRSRAERHLTALEVAEAITNARAQADNAAILAKSASGPSLAAAQEAARIARIGYREGKFGQLDLLDAERTLAETRVAAIDALAAYHNARAQLERLTAPAPKLGN